MPCMEITLPHLELEIRRKLARELTDGYADSTGMDRERIGIRFLEYGEGETAYAGKLWEGGEGRRYVHVMLYCPRQSRKVKQEIVRRLNVRDDECYSWGLHSGPALDLLVVSGARRIGFEVKRTSSPSITRSMRSAMETLALDHLDLVHAGEKTFPLSDGVRALSCRRLLTDLTPLR